MRSIDNLSSFSTHDAVPDERNQSVHIFINGKFYPREEAKISVFDSGYLVGDGVWEGIRLKQGAYVFLDDHLDRLFQGAQAIGLDLGHDRDWFADALYQTAAQNRMWTDVHARLMVTRGIKKTPSQDPRLVQEGPTIVIIAEHKQASPETTERGISLFTATIRRPGPDSLDPRLNCHSKLHEVIALVQALHAGADEALMLDPTGHVATCNSTNFFIVREGTLWTSTGEYCLHGITRKKLIEAASQRGITVKEAPFSLADVYHADEAFVTGTFGGITPVIEIDGRPIAGTANGTVIRQLREGYDQLCQKSIEEAHAAGRGLPEKA
jgi:branched-chain amino acid aminotransferase